MLLAVAKKKVSHNRAFSWPLKPHTHTGYLIQHRHSPGKFNEVRFVSYLMVKTIDGKNELWPTLLSGGLWPALPHSLFGWHSTKNITWHLKTGMWSISYITGSSGSSRPATLHSTNWMKFRTSCSLRGESIQITPVPLMCLICLAPQALGWGFLHDVIKVPNQGPPGRRNVCVGGRVLSRDTGSSYSLCCQRNTIVNVLMFPSIATCLALIIAVLNLAWSNLWREVGNLFLNLFLGTRGWCLEK